jgi:pimeloyl-ACP methyl ester carboxylesterase
MKQLTCGGKERRGVMVDFRSTDASDAGRQTSLMKSNGMAALGLMLAMCGLAGCSAPAPAPREHVVLVDHSGVSLYVNAPTNQQRFLHRETDSDFLGHLSAITNAIATDTNCIGPDGVKRILIFVHGGLNSYSVSLGRVNLDTPKIAGANYYPIFINWDSGLISSYLEHLWNVRQGEVRPYSGPLTSPLYLIADLGRAVTRAPVVWYYQITSDLTTVARYETPYIWATNRLRAQETNSSEMEDHLKLWIGGDKRSGAGKFWRGTSYVVTFPLKLLTAPLIDAMGKSAWDNMSRRTQSMFRSPDEFKSPGSEGAIDTARERAGEQPWGNVARLMQALAELTVTNDPGRYSITLIGHSMGTIVANEIIRDHPDLPYTNIVYMAAACTVSDFAQSVVPCLEHRATNANFYNLTLHPIAEAEEAQWFVLDITPRGSLLEWIDNFLSEPRTVPERTLGEWNNIVATTALIPSDVARRTRIKAFPVGPKDRVPPNTPRVHGDFSDEPYWDPNFWTWPERRGSVEK